MCTASETVALVLDEEGPVLDSDDVSDLTARLRGHVPELVPLADGVSPNFAALHAAVAEGRRLAEQEAPAGDVLRRDHLRRLATAVQKILNQLDGTPAVFLHPQSLPFPSAAEATA
ncbi:DUF6415 family natural product biosynthesis protein [Streptomyces niveus]|uniref:DUF6415 family natural product biosynthesis protein n=1 Tax=Streptomyces niveus TaxID=193462 RepID=UPI0036CC4653